jgi:hypothetical protein
MSNETDDVKKDGLTREQHRERHKILHAHLDELFADYIEHHRDERQFTQMPLIKLIQWSYEQTFNPTEKPQL